MDMLAQQVSESVNWNTFVNSEMLSLIVFLVLGGLVVIIAIIARQWRQVRVAETEAGIKLRMIERGFSAEEIERVLQTGMAAGQHGRRRRSAPVEACRPSDFVQGNACG